MNETRDFIDYYAVLQVDPNCQTKALEAAYRSLAKMYHPDHPETADVTKFNEVIEAYRVLRYPDQRAEYDRLYAANKPDYVFEFLPNQETEAGEKAALSDADAHATILSFLYKRRREHAQDPGVGGYFVQELLNCSDDHFEFHLWYLKAKGFIEVTEQGALAITIQGVDHVIATSRTAMREKLLIAQASDDQDEAWS